MGKNKFTTKINTCNMPTCQGGHDLGPLIPDITIPPLNVYMPPIGWPFSKRVIVFQSATVSFQGKPVGCAAAPFFPMMTCGDPVSLPTVFPIPINYLHRTFVGITLSDIFSGILNIGISVLIDAIFHKIGGGSGNPASEAAQQAAERTAKEAAERAAREMGEQAAREAAALATRNAIGEAILGKLVPTSREAAAKAIVSALAGYGESMVNESLNPSGNAPSTKVSVGGGIVPTVDLTIGGQPNEGPDNAPAGSGELGRREVGGQRVSANSEGGNFGDPLDIF
ncbi:MAG: hypothetical protein QNK19_15505 [Xanthomonadales bacterium]|nr:hypothetical protein [Xanthomonadales bacterium]